MTTTVPTAGPPVDWAVAARVAGRLVPPGPAAGRDEAAGLVADLHRSARVAATHVPEAARMSAGDGPLSRVLVVDRATWARANTEMLAALTVGVAAAAGDRAPSRAARTAGGVQVGTVLALLSGRVLGQFDPFSPRPAPSGGVPEPGRLLLVAPNVLRVEQVLRVDPRDFRLWVALHEQTHALQFAAAPWLEGHLRDRMGALLRDLGDEASPDAGRRGFLGGAVRAVRGRAAGPAGLPALLPEATRRVLDEVGAVMALLEGHADVTMDAVGRSVVPSVRQIRTRFDRRRAGSHGVTGLVLRRLLGLDVKLAQYRDGARFVRRVRRTVGAERLNAVWAGPANLPTPDEIRDPREWIRRVHG